MASGGGKKPVGLQRFGNALKNILFTSVSKKGNKFVPDPETGKITVHVSEMDFVATNYSALLVMERNFDIDEGDSEAILADAMEKVVAVLRSNPLQRRLVRKQLFYDSDVGKGKPDTRILAGNLKDYFNLAHGPSACPSLVFLELTIELLAIFILGVTTDNTTNAPRTLDTAEPSLNMKKKDFRRGSGGDNNIESSIVEKPTDPESLGTPTEIAYCIKLGVVNLLDAVIGDKTALGVTPFLLGKCSQTLCWAVALYRHFIEVDEIVTKHAYDKMLLRTSWDIVSHKTKIRDPLANRIANLKISALYVLKELGRTSVDQFDSPESINMINLNPRSIKELTKLLHHYPDMHPTILVVLTMVAQKQVNNNMLKDQGMMEYLTTKVLPFFSDAHHKSVPHLVILLNSWIVTFEDLQYFYQFNGIQCLVYHLKTAIQAETQNTGGQEDANWEDMVLHGLSILYKLSDSKQYHLKMVTDDCLTVLLECLRVVDPLKSAYHMNGFIAALYSLRNLCGCSIMNRGAVVAHEQFFVLTHLLSMPSLPINCLIHLLFLFVLLAKDHHPPHPPDPNYRDAIMNTIFPSAFAPLCKLIKASPIRHTLDDSQLTVICLALQTLAMLVSTAKQENPLLCIQIEHDLPLQTLKAMARANSKTPYPNLANEVLGMVYLMP